MESLDCLDTKFGLLVPLCAAGGVFARVTAALVAETGVLDKVDTLEQPTFGTASRPVLANFSFEPPDASSAFRLAVVGRPSFVVLSACFSLKAPCVAKEDRALVKSDVVEGEGGSLLPMDLRTVFRN